MEPLHTEYPAKGKVNLAYAAKPARRSFVVNFIRVLSQYISLMCHVYPTLCATFMFICIGLALFGLGEAIFNPRVKYGYVAHDHSNLKSVFDYKLANIDHWCLRGDSDSCRCDDPLQPISRAEFNSWTVAFKTNRKIVKALEEDPSSDVDIAFVGESIVEEMDGRWMGMERGGNLATLKQIFDSHFNKKKGGQLNGVALGIAGDTSPNVLFRLMHGEMSQKLHPKIYWLSLGMNDLSRMMCSEEVVVLGILRVVEEIINNTNSYVVINSVFPMSQMRGTAYPVLSDATEAFQAARPPLRGRNRNVYDPRLVAPAAQRLPRADFNGRSLQAPLRPAVTDDVLKAAAQKEEEARDEEWKRTHREKNRAAFFRDRQKHMAQLNEQHRIRKHANMAKLPLWTSVAAVNFQLAKYARNNPGRISFFDATPLFAEREDSRHFQLRLDRITPRGHPTQAGYMAWESAVATRAISLVQQWKEEHPEKIYVAKNDDETSPFDMDSFMNSIHDQEDDDLNDDEVFKNQDDAWMDRLGDEIYDEEQATDDSAGNGDEEGDEGDDDDNADDDEGDDDNVDDDEEDDDNVDDDEDNDNADDYEGDDNNADDDDAGDDDNADDDEAGDDDNADDNEAGNDDNGDEGDDDAA
eukprot:scaffold965_cov158-Amphora_coffeaeformis.AAC.8